MANTILYNDQNDDGYCSSGDEDQVIYREHLETSSHHLTSSLNSAGRLQVKNSWNHHHPANDDDDAHNLSIGLSLTQDTVDINNDDDNNNNNSNDQHHAPLPERRLGSRRGRPTWKQPQPQPPPLPPRNDENTRLEEGSLSSPITHNDDDERSSTNNNHDNREGSAGEKAEDTSTSDAFADLEQELEKLSQPQQPAPAAAHIVVADTTSALPGTEDRSISSNHNHIDDSKDSDPSLEDQVPSQVGTHEPPLPQKTAIYQHGRRQSMASSSLSSSSLNESRVSDEPPPPPPPQQSMILSSLGPSQPMQRIQASTTVAHLHPTSTLARTSMLDESTTTLLDASRRFLQKQQHKQQKQKQSCSYYDHQEPDPISSLLSSNSVRRVGVTKKQSMIPPPLPPPAKPLGVTRAKSIVGSRYVYMR